MSYQKLITYIGMGAMTVSISSITYTAKSILDVINGISSLKGTNINANLSKFDLTNKIQIIQSLLEEIKHIESNAIDLALLSIKDILINIEYELFKINSKAKYNSSLYIFYYLRSYDFVDQLDKIEKYSIILDSRLNLLFNLIKIKENLKNNYDKQNKQIKTKDLPPDYDSEL